MALWVALQPIFEDCTGEKGYGGGGSRREEWWHQEEAEKQLISTLEEISPEAKRRRQQGNISIQYDTGECGEAEREFWMLGRIRETPGWADDLVC